MRIVVDIGHPAHVHFFKNFIYEMRKKRHEVLITAADKDIAQKLLEALNFEYIKIGRTGKSFLRKVISVPVLDYNLFKAVRPFNPDIFLGIGSIRAAHVAKALGKKSIIFNDTEATLKEHILYLPFADFILTPSCFGRNFGKKHIRYEGYHELAYLHPSRFKPNPEILQELNVSPNEKFFVIRFIAWQATHDIGKKGFSLEGKIKLVNVLKDKGKVLITSEGPLPEALKNYSFPMNPAKMHDVMSYATLCITEGATMASEAAMLGTPSVYVSNLNFGTIREQSERYGLIRHAKNEAKAMAIIRELLNKPDLREIWRLKRAKLLKDKIDVTGMMVEFVDLISKKWEEGS